MKSTLFSLLFILGACFFSFGQYPDSYIYVTNSTGDDLALGVQTTTVTPNSCPSGWTSMGPIYIPASAVDYPVFLGTAVAPAPAIRPWKVACSEYGTGAGASWQINECWNPSCVSSYEPAYDIQFTYCADDYKTYITIY